jgi:hypothetical protein
MSFNLEDYEPVEDRIRQFYADHENGRIHTVLLSDPNEIQTVVVKAQVFVGIEMVATGLAFERAGEGFVNKTAHLENCETSAIGRALANYNYAGKKRPSREEMEKASQPEKKEPGIDYKVAIAKMLDINKSALDDETIKAARAYITGDHTPEQFKEAHARLAAKVDEGRAKP